VNTKTAAACHGKATQIIFVFEPNWWTYQSAKTNPSHLSKLRMTLLFSKIFGTFTDLLQHPFKLLQLF
jgi:hypothetical protein